MAVGKANITLRKIREVLNQQIEPQCAQQTHTHTHTHTLSLIHTQYRQHLSEISASTRTVAPKLRDILISLILLSLSRKNKKVK